MSTLHEKPKRNIPYLIIGIVFIFMGVLLWRDGIEAIRTGTMIAATSKHKAMTGYDALFYGTCAEVIGATAIVWGFRGKYR